MIAELEVIAAEIVERTRAEQGKPRYVEDAETLTRVAVEISGGSRRGVG